MTKEEILEGNELIARFAGKGFPGGHITDWRKLPDEINKKYLKYHRDYSQLIPVYNKITRQELYGRSEEGFILFNIIYDSLGDAEDIIEVWKNIVKFIKWYNINRI